jgi:uncharacterized membrane protein YjgN (DUF898 family)
MKDIPDYSKYTLNELKDVYNAVDRKKHPDNYQAIVNEIEKRKTDCASLYTEARSGYEEGSDLQKAGQLFQKLIEEYPDTPQAEQASRYIDNIIDKLKKDSEGAPAKQQDMKLEFSGSAREYFRIWIVNLCLTLLTIGIFSAWAKVRKKRYFYSHLTLDETPFQYLAQPIPILKGRVIAAILFLLYYLSSHVFTAFFPYVIGAGLILAPWVIVRSVAFNARYSAYRNMTFSFEGNYVKALKVISAWGLIPAIAVGTIFNWGGKYWVAGILFALFGFHFPWWIRRLKNFIVTKTSYGGQFGQFGATGGDFFVIYLLAGFITFGFVLITGITAAVSSSVIKGRPYIAFVLMMPIYAGYVFAYAYVQANITNTVWNRIRLGPVRFNCTLKSFDLVKLYLTNAIGIIASVGLLIPWAVIRTFRYRADHTQVINTAELKEFQGSETVTVQAAGAELGEFFDMDLSL